MEINISDRIAGVAPKLKVLVIEAKIKNKPTDDILWEKIKAEARRIKDTYAIEDIRHRPAIDATRAVYKALGKDPNRYRPSAEALCRRAVKGLELYRTLTVIDLVNLLSMQSGHSIGAFDADYISGDSLTLGVGQEGEPYQAIGRGNLNIAALPVYRDSLGGIGTPTSDNERTRLRPETSNLLITLNMYGSSEMAEDQVCDACIEYLREYACATDIIVRTIGI